MKIDMQKKFKIDERAPLDEVKKLEKFLAKGGDARQLTSRLLQKFDPPDKSGFIAYNDKKPKINRIGPIPISEEIQGSVQQICEHSNMIRILSEFKQWSDGIFSEQKDCHFRSVTNNLIILLGLLEYIFRKYETISSEEKEQMELTLKSAKTYRIIVDKFPEFKEFELGVLKTESHIFRRLTGMKNNVHDYIAEAVQILEEAHRNE